jgi:O-antigen/teichoic acid export membrane protein
LPSSERHAFEFYRYNCLIETPPTIRSVDLRTGSPDTTATIFSNVLANLARAAAVSLVTLLLPAYLTHHLSVTLYAAWILILQLGAYVSYFDLGVQTGVSKFVAEYGAKDEYAGAGRHASAGLALMSLAAMLGLGLTFLLAWEVPSLFAAMPSNLYREVRISLLLVGASLSFSLVCSVYSAVFLGLQRYWIPTALTVVNRVSYAVIVIAVVALHGNLADMGLAVASVNVITGILQVGAWHKTVPYVRLSIDLVEFRVLKKVARFCSLQSIWTIGMLCVTGLDITIVGHYDYGQTAYYSIATLPSNFLLLIIVSMLGPMMPASSAMSTRQSPVKMGEFLARITRYCTVVLLLTGLALIVCGFPVLRLWVGTEYATHTLLYLRVLVLANIIRNLCAPYATMISATGQQAAAIATAVCEALVNLGSSLYLASHLGAIGVAFGTLIGSFVSVLLHFAITMRFTRSTLAISRLHLFRQGLLHPTIIIAPCLLLVLPWRTDHYLRLNPPLGLLWAGTTIMIAWFGVLKKDERQDVMHLVGRWRMLTAKS